mmetsp:Transcript_8545/g.14409  ORF Transcript_8545/g.14409 Transcript_8545/m.14409 type:complete len:160 (-) Transcript_8545:4-483(-)
MEFALKKDLDYLCNLFFVSMAFYLLAVTIKGNATLGFRFASPLFYPMRENETQFNSFMFNVLLLNACSLAITEYSGLSMEYYTMGNTYLFQMTQLLLYSDLMFYITRVGLIRATIITLSALTILFNVMKGSYRLRFQDLERIYQKRGRVGKSGMVLTKK